MKRLLTLLVLGVAFALPAAAFADSTYYFELTNITSPGVTIDFSIASSATPVSGDVGDITNAITFSPVTFTFVGQGSGTDSITLGTFGGDPVLLLFSFVGLGFPNSDLTTFYTGGGTTAAFTPGDYTLSDLTNDDDTDAYNLAVSDTPFSVVTPEPSSLALLSTGALGMAGAIRRRYSRA